MYNYGYNCYTPCYLINDTFTITRGMISKYTKKYDVEYEYNCYINIFN